MKNQIFNNWNFMRWLRLGLGTAITVQSMYTHEIAMTAIGVVYAGMAVLNTGCCCVGSCTVPRAKNPSEPKDV